MVVSEEGQSADNLAATVIAEDPPTVLVEFSSVVADTQEYIIEVTEKHMAESASCAGRVGGLAGLWPGALLVMLQAALGQWIVSSDGSGRGL